ncbi:hypothetical protein BJY04DRAFT_156126 [Aspergillus karnatakaensis]|uniref:F-box protein n=1 Tax=Aspergillus karnatakaensis TaxID=1810916 RepID=UPI003CCD9EE8
MTTATSLDSLPVEIQCSIIRLLDPIGLISLSQTSQHFRDLIKPKKTHFVERLLALECVAEIGGPPIKFSRFGALEPDRASPEWEANLWACTSCLKLLPQYRFTNQALSQIVYRKPIPGSPAATAWTRWEPGSSAPFREGLSLEGWRKKYDDDEARYIRRRYGFLATDAWGRARISYDNTVTAETHLERCLTDLRNCWIEEFEEILTDSQEDSILNREAYYLEHLRAGTNRYARRCLECRFRRGEFRGCTGLGKGLGTPTVPIVPGRQVSYGTVVDRYFPDISDVLDTKRPAFNAPLFVIYRDDATDRRWTLFRVRCQGCSEWKEMRAFRAGGVYQRWQPFDCGSSRAFNDLHPNWDKVDVTEAWINNLRCNHCFVKSHGREALGDLLVTWIVSLIEAQLPEIINFPLRGFYALKSRLRFCPEDRKHDLKDILLHISPLLNKKGTNFTRADIALMRQKRAQFLAIEPKAIEDERMGAGWWASDDPYLNPWGRMFDQAEAVCLWLKGAKDELLLGEGKKEVLAEWALARDELVHS